jgi:hypothetical protein
MSTIRVSSSIVLTSTDSWTGGYTGRIQIPANLLPQHDGVRIRFTLLAAAGTTTDAKIDNAWIGYGSGVDFDGNQVRLTFNGGSHSLTFVNGPGTYVSDFMIFRSTRPRTLFLAFIRPPPGP